MVKVRAIPRARAPGRPTSRAGLLRGRAGRCSVVRSSARGLPGFVGALVKIAYDRICARRRASLSPEKAQRRAKLQEESGIVVASGVLGGESVVGVLIAFASVAAGLTG